MAHTFKLLPNWSLINSLSEIDKFVGSWSTIEKREGSSLRQLKSIATVRSVGASTRIEGSKMTDDEVKVLIDNLKFSNLEERDQQEVAGYFEALDVVCESYQDMDITENSIKGLHNLLLKHSEKDEWHRGNYKQLSNAVEAKNADGSKRVIFNPSAPGFETEDAMRKLVDWYNSDIETHPIVRSAVFVYDLLSIHPFQDGNGRLSRLLGTLLLLKNGYPWVQYVSFEHEIENRKSEYYRVLMECQKQRPGENVYPWIMFFLECLSNIRNQLITKLDSTGSFARMTEREKRIYQFVENHPGGKSGQLAEKLDIPLPTVKRILAEMVRNKFLMKHGIGSGTHYTVERIISSIRDENVFGGEIEARLKAVKEKVRSMQVDELQTTATYKLLQDIFKNGLRPLYIKIIHTLSTEFKDEYLTHSFRWHLNNTLVNRIEDVEAFWKKEENLRSVTEISFDYVMYGLKKAGTENYNESLSLKFMMDTYWYGFALVNHNNQQPFLKKMYHQQLTPEDNQAIIELLVTKVLDRIEWALEHFNAKIKMDELKRK